MNEKPEQFSETVNYRNRGNPLLSMCAPLFEEYDRRKAQEAAESAVDQEPDLIEPEPIEPRDGFPAYVRYDYIGKGCTDWQKGPKEAVPSTGSDDRARQCPNNHAWGTFWIGSRKKSCPGCGQNVPAATDSSTVAGWDVPCTLTKSKAGRGTGYAIQVNDTGIMPKLSTTKDPSKATRGVSHANGKAARLKQMLMLQGYKESDAEYHARFPFEWRDRNAMVLLKQKLAAGNKGDSDDNSLSKMEKLKKTIEYKKNLKGKLAEEIKLLEEELQKEQAHQELEDLSDWSL